MWYLVREHMQGQNKIGPKKLRSIIIQKKKQSLNCDKRM